MRARSGTRAFVIAVGVTIASAQACSSAPPPREASESSVGALSLGPPPPVLTQRNDLGRTGTYRQQGFNASVFHPDNHWGLLGVLPVDGVVWSQPLYVPSLSVGGVTRNVLYVTTAKNHLYAFDADSLALLWDRRLGPAGSEPDHTVERLVPGRGSAGMTPIEVNGANARNGIGIQSTPVIDSDSRLIYLTYRTEQRAGAGNFTIAQHVAAVSIVDGAVTSDYVLTAADLGGQDIRGLRQRASLLLSQKLLYLGFGSHIEDPDVFYGRPEFRFRGALVALDTKTMRVVGTFKSVPNDKFGGGIWQASTGPAADADGGIYFTTGNTMSLEEAKPGTPREDVIARELDPECTPGPNKNPNACRAAGNAVIRLQPSITRDAGGNVSSFSFPTSPSRPAGIKDFFMPYRAVWQNAIDLDLGSAGTLLVPNSRAVVLGGKEGIIYVMNRDQMGGHDVESWDHAKYEAECARRGLVCGVANAQLNVPDDPARDPGAWQKLYASVNQNPGCDRPAMDDWMQWPHIHGTPVYADLPSGDGYLYVWPEKDHLKAFKRKRSTDPKVTFEPSPRGVSKRVAPLLPRPGGMPGGMLSLVVDPSDAAGAGVLFASVPVDQAAPVNRATLVAYHPVPNDAGELVELWSDDGPGYGLAKFVPPTAANGRVYMATASNSVLVYGTGVRPGGIAAERQNPNQITALTVGSDGALYVMWEANDTPWHLPVRISDAAFAPPGANVATILQPGGPMYAFVVSSAGRLSVATNDGLGAWSRPTPISEPGTFPPGAPVTAGIQAGNVVDAFAVDAGGHLQVAWHAPGEIEWHGPGAISKTCAPNTPPRAFRAGAVLATGRQAGHVLDVFGVDTTGALTVSWLVDNAATWNGPCPISNANFAPSGAGVATGKQGANTLDAFVVDNSGTLTVSWLVGDDPRGWHPPAQIRSSVSFPPGAAIATGIEGADQLDVFAVDRNGAVTVSWLVGEGVAGWSGPAEMPRLGIAPAGSRLAAAHQSERVLDVLVAAHSSVSGRYTIDHGGWNAPPFRPF